MKIYTWKDIERYCLKNKKKWQAKIANIEVYPEEIIVSVKSNENYSEAEKIFEELFPKNISEDKSYIKLDMQDKLVKIIYEEDIIDYEKKMKPLFQRAIYEESVYPSEKLNDLECPVIAFHSYKGGVGRTLSLIAFAKAWTNLEEDGKLLIVDSDIEAPGLTWIQKDRDENSFSYLDLLTLIQDTNIKNINDVVEDSAKEIGNLRIPIETEKQLVEHFFLPTFRYDEQLFDLYASPHSVIQGRKKEYIISEILAKIAKKIGAKAVLIDLRAGISEYSAPILLDPRVIKYCVTSTSEQSVMGTKKILEFISKGLKIDAKANIPKVFLNMVPREINRNEIEKISNTFTDCIQTNEQNEQLLDNMVIMLQFASELVHLTNITQILDLLEDRQLYKSIKELVLQYHIVTSKNENEFDEEHHKIMLRKIQKFAEAQITAEADGAAELLLTKPIRNICMRYKDELPTVVVRGAKGSGKTFLYKKLVKEKDWTSFSSNINEKQKIKENGYILPILAPQNMSKFNEALKKCIDNFNEKISCAEVSNAVYIDNTNKLLSIAEKEINWIEFWEELFVKSVNPKFTSLDELSKNLKQSEAGIVFIIDGLEEILKDVSSSAKQQKAVQILCQNMLNIITAKYDNIGLVIFLRSDMAQSAITVNYEQFIQAFNYAELKWSSDEALKLAVWLVSQAVEGFYEESVLIENASREIIDIYLKKLWGLKLGKNNSNEAYSSRWILAALSDFNGQLQARDIIRFLKYAAEPNSKKVSYYDRILMPTEIRNAVSVCSKDKIREIKMEYQALKPIFQKLENLPIEKKILPLNLEEDSLTSTEEKLMIQMGYLTRDGEKLYLPEIIRHALGFRYEKGARPKVLSLLRL